MHLISGIIPTFDTQHQYHQIQKVSKPSNHPPNKGILCDKNASLNSRITLLDSVVTSLVCFGPGQCKLYNAEVRKLDVHCRKLLHQVVGPPGSIDWDHPCRSILHQRNQRVVEQMQLNCFQLSSHRNIFLNIGHLFDSRWLKRALAWNRGWQPEYGGVAGCGQGQSSLAAICRILSPICLRLTPCALNGLPHHGIQEQSQSQSAFAKQGIPSKLGPVKT